MALVTPFRYRAAAPTAEHGCIVPNQCVLDALNRPATAGRCNVIKATELAQRILKRKHKGGKR